MDSDVNDSATGTGKIFRRVKTFSALKNPVFRLYIGSTLGGQAAMSMQMMTRSYLIYRLTGSSALLGVLALANSLPSLSLSLIGGTIADRMQKKNVLMIGQVSSALITLVVALALTTEYLSSENDGSWWLLIATSLLQGTMAGLVMPSRQALVAEIVSGKHLMNALALNNMVMNILRLGAPALAGILIDNLGFQAVFYVMPALYLVSTIFIAFIPLTSSIRVGGQGIFAELVDGLKYVRHEKRVLAVLVFLICTIFLSASYNQLLPIFTDDILKVGPTGMGILVSASGFGALAGSLSLASMPNPDRRRGTMLLLASMLVGVSLMVFAFSRSWYLSLVVAVFIGLGHTGRITLSNTLLQYYADENYRGRVMSIYHMEIGLTSFGVFLGGVLAETIGVQWVVGSFGLLLLLVSTAALIFVPAIRDLN